MKDNRKKNLLILGGGAVVLEYYVPAIEALSDQINAIIIDLQQANIDKIKTKSPAIAAITGDYKQYLQSMNESDFDAVLIALPNWLHNEAVTLALNKGLHVLCEKPLTLDKQSSIELGELAKQKQRSLQVAMVRRYIPFTESIKELIASSALGDIDHVTLSFGAPYGWMSDTGDFFDPINGGVLADMGSHFLDMFYYWFGDMEIVQYDDDWQGGVEANCELQLKTKKGNIPITLTLSRTHNLNNEVNIIGSEGTLDVSTAKIGEPVVKINKMKNTELTLKKQPPFESGTWPMQFAACFVEQFYQYFKRLNDNLSPTVTAFDAANIMEIVEKCYSSRSQKEITKQNDLRPIQLACETLVTGATGFIGSHLVERLASMGFKDVVCPVRNYRSCANIARFSYARPKMNLLDYGSVKKTLEGRKCIYHLAYGAGAANEEAINVIGTKNIVNAAIECGAEVVVVPSTMYVYGQPKTDQLVDETWPYAPVGGVYGSSKVKMEKWLLNRAKTSGKTRIVVLNPSCIYGPRGGAYSNLPASMAIEGRFVWIDDGIGIANVTYVDNLVDALVLAATTPEAHGQRFLINDVSITWKEFITPLLGPFADNIRSSSHQTIKFENIENPLGLKDVVGHILKDYELKSIVNQVPWLKKLKKIIFHRMPSFKNELTGIGIEHARRSISLVPQTVSEPVPPSWLGDLFGPAQTKFSSHKAQSILKWQPLVDLKSGQKKTVDWLTKASFFNKPKQ